MAHDAGEHTRQASGRFAWSVAMGLASKPMFCKVISGRIKVVARSVERGFKTSLRSRNPPSSPPRRAKD